MLDLFAKVPPEISSWGFSNHPTETEICSSMMLALHGSHSDDDNCLGACKLHGFKISSPFKVHHHKSTLSKPQTLISTLFCPSGTVTQYTGVRKPATFHMHHVVQTSTNDVFGKLNAGSRAKFPVTLSPLEPHIISERIEYCINGSHMLSFGVTANVSAVNVELSSEELTFEFSLDKWDDYVEKVGAVLKCAMQIRALEVVQCKFLLPSKHISSLRTLFFL